MQKQLLQSEGIMNEPDEEKIKQRSDLLNGKQKDLNEDGKQKQLNGNSKNDEPSVAVVRTHHRFLQALLRKEEEQEQQHQQKEHREQRQQELLRRGRLTKKENQKRSKLLQLQRKRLAWEAKLGALRNRCCQLRTAMDSTTTTSVADQLISRKRAADDLVSYLFPLLPQKSNSLRANHDGTTVITNQQQHATMNTNNLAAADIVQQELNQRDLAQRLQTRRNRRKFAAAYRMAGITISVTASKSETKRTATTNKAVGQETCENGNKNGDDKEEKDDEDDQNNAQDQIFCIRLEIASSQGEYVACYRVFLESVVAIVEDDDDDEVVIRGKNKKKDSNYGNNNSNNRNDTVIDETRTHQTNPPSPGGQSHGNHEHSHIAEGDDAQIKIAAATCGQFVIRLKQHTMPLGVPCEAIVRETVGGGRVFGNEDTEDIFFEAMRECAARLFRACSCYVERK